LLGEALTGQKPSPEAERLLLSARKALEENRNKITPIDQDETLRDAVGRLVRLYEAWGKPAEAETRRKKLAALPPVTQPKPQAHFVGTHPHPLVAYCDVLDLDAVSVNPGLSTAGPRSSDDARRLRGLCLWGG